MILRCRSAGTDTSPTAPRGRPPGHAGTDRVQRHTHRVTPRPAQSLRGCAGVDQECDRLIVLELGDEPTGRVDPLFIFRERYADDVGHTFGWPFLCRGAVGKRNRKRCCDNEVEQRVFP